jgi:dipeptidyl aminopeptidase/acylaminoacyl peptidase
MICRGHQACLGSSHHDIQTEGFAAMSTTSDSPPALAREPVHFFADGLRIAGHFTRAAGASPEARGPTVVCVHGYTGRKEIYMPGYIRELSAAGYNALEFYHRGFGDSEGPRLRCKPWDQVTDILSAVIYLRQRPDVDPDRVGLYGTSFGGTTGMMAAAHDETIRCAVSVGSSGDCLRSSYDRRTYSDRLDWEELMKVDRIERVMTGQSRRIPYGELAPSGRAERDSIDTMYKVDEKYPEGYPMENFDHTVAFAPERYVERIAPRPVLFIHTERDTMVAVTEARHFYARAREPKQLIIIPGANHVDVYEPRTPQVFKIVVGHITDFFDKHLRPQAAHH